MSSPATMNYIVEITDLADKVFGNRKTADEWLKQRNLATDDRPPIELLTTSGGFERVKTLLLQIEYGVLA